MSLASFIYYTVVYYIFSSHRDLFYTSVVGFLICYRAQDNNANIDAVEEEGDDDEFAPSADSPPAEATQEESSIFNFSSDSEDAFTPTADGGSNEDFPGDISPLARNGAGGGRGGRGGSNFAGSATTTAPVDRSVAGGGTTAGTATANTPSTSTPTVTNASRTFAGTATTNPSTSASTAPTGAAASTSTSSAASSRTGDTGLGNGNNTNDAAAAATTTTNNNNNNNNNKKKSTGAVSDGSSPARLKDWNQPADTNENNRQNGGYRRKEPTSPITSPPLAKTYIPPLSQILAESEEFASSEEEGGGAARGGGENRGPRLGGGRVRSTGRRRRGAPSQRSAGIW